MVSTAIHYIVGILICWFFGVKDNRKYLLGLIAAAPDLDAILMFGTFFAGRLFNFNVDWLDSNQALQVLFAHINVNQRNTPRLEF